MEGVCMRNFIAIVFIVLIAALLICMFLARRSKKEIKGHVSFLTCSMSIPVIGNLLLILSTTQFPATIGYYVYFIGMDIAVFSLWHFMHAYCELGKPNRTYTILIYTLFGIDLIQYALNPFFGFSFTTEKFFVDHNPYYRLVPYIGQTYHRIICYGLFFVILIVFFRAQYLLT